jgi:hypothetical protein
MVDSRQGGMECSSNGLGSLGQKRKRGTVSGSPSHLFLAYAVAASAGRRQGAHRKSGVVIRPSYACPVES